MPKDRKRAQRRLSPALYPLVWRAADAGPGSCAPASGASHRVLAGLAVAKLKSALRSERRRGTAGQTGYDPDRHLALLRALRNESTGNGALSRGSAPPHGSDKNEKAPPG